MGQGSQLELFRSQLQQRLVQVRTWGEEDESEVWGELGSSQRLPAFLFLYIVEKVIRDPPRTTR